MSGPNIIELIVRAVDQVSGPLRSMGRSVENFSDTVKKGAAAVGLGLGIREFVEANRDAQASLAQLDIAYRNSSESARRSKDDIIAFANAQLKSSQFGDEAVIQSQTTLLRFSRVSREVFERARRDVLDVSAALGIDLQQATESVGRALESPTQGLRNLRQLNIVFTQSQRDLIQKLEESGRVYEAQNILLDALEDHYRGAAKASSETLGGALDRLKNNFQELLELSDKSGGKATEQINELADAVGSHTVQDGVKRITDSFAEMYDEIKKVASLGPSTLKKMAEEANKFLPERFQIGFLSHPGEDERVNGSPGHGPIKRPLTDEELQQRAEDARFALLKSLDEVKVTAVKEETAGLAKLMREWGDEAQSSGQKASAALERTKILLDELEQNEISKALGRPGAGIFDDMTKAADVVQIQLQAAERYKTTVEEIIDSQLQLIDINAIAARKLVEPLPAATARIREFVDTIKEGLQNAAAQGQITGRSITKYLVAAFESKLIYRAIDMLGAYIEKTLVKATSSSGSGGGKSSFWGNALNAAASFFFSAGGGETSGLTMVGENGPELVSGRNKVWNTQQLRWAMAGGPGGGGASQVQINEGDIIIQGNADEKTAAMIRTESRARQRETLRIIDQKLKDNGYGRLR